MLKGKLPFLVQNKNIISLLPLLLETLPVFYLLCDTDWRHQEEMFLLTLKCQNLPQKKQEPALMTSCGSSVF